MWSTTWSVLVSPSPKSHTHVSMPSSGSVESVASNVHVSPVQVRFMTAVGGWFGGGVASPAGRRRTVHMVAVLALELAFAVRPPVLAGVPAVSAAGRSVSRVPTRPPPEPNVVARVVSPAGAVQPVVALLLSDQYDTRQAPSVLLGTSGVVCEAVLPGSPAPVIETRGLTGSAPR